MTHDILIVDDEADIRMLIAGILEDEGYRTREAADADAALAAVKARLPNLVILDIWLEGSRLDGLQILEQLRATHQNLPVLMISGHGTIETAVSAIKQGAYDFIEKPFKSDRLLHLVARATEAARLRRENEELLTRAGGKEQLIGTSAQMRHVRDGIAKVATANSRVFITGGPGCGKEVVARAIHGKSARADGPLVVVNCAAMHPDRMEQELFGSEEMGDQPRRIGLLEQAHGGTLLLDEVLDMPLETQGKILRLLERQTFERVGGTNRVEVDVRVLSTTNREVQKEVAQGRFREDLYYRLAVISIKVPALAERREDIPDLARHFMEVAARANGMAQRGFGQDALAALQAYDWPGNVRQLRNVVDWLLIMAPGDAKDPIRADMLPPEISSKAPTTLRLENSSDIMSLPLRDARELFEREYLSAQLMRFGGNISRTAEFVGMERSALHRKLKARGVGGDGK